MPTLSESTQAKQALLDLQATVDLWHEKQKQKIVNEVLILKNMQSLSEKSSVSYINNIAEDAEKLLQSLKIQGTQN